MSWRDGRGGVRGGTIEGGEKEEVGLIGERD